MSVRPLKDRVLLQRQEAPEKTPGGLFIPENAKEKPTYAKVISVGREATDVKKDDVVLISKYAGSEVKVNGESMVLVKEEEILGILDPPQ